MGRRTSFSVPSIRVGGTRRCEPSYSLGHLLRKREGQLAGWGHRDTRTTDVSTPLAGTHPSLASPQLSMAALCSRRCQKTSSREGRMVAMPC